MRLRAAFPCESLGNSAAAVLIFLAAAAGTRIVAADLGHLAAHGREFEFYVAVASLLAVAADRRAHSFGTTARYGTGCGRRSRRLFAQEELRERGEESFEGLQV